MRKKSSAAAHALHKKSVLSAKASIAILRKAALSKNFQA
jgi:hypothetical protein